MLAAGSKSKQKPHDSEADNTLRCRYPAWDQTPPPRTTTTTTIIVVLFNRRPLLNFASVRRPRGSFYSEMYTFGGSSPNGIKSELCTYRLTGLKWSLSFSVAVASLKHFGRTFPEILAHEGRLLVNWVYPFSSVQYSVHVD